MSNKMTCLGCNSHTSSVLQAFENGDPCPNCGLSAEATLEIHAVRKSQADERMKQKCEQLVKERDEAQRELRWAKQRLERLGQTLKDATTRLEQPLEEEEGTRW